MADIKLQQPNIHDRKLSSRIHRRSAKDNKTQAFIDSQRVTASMILTGLSGHSVTMYSAGRREFSTWKQSHRIGFQEDLTVDRNCSRNMAKKCHKLPERRVGTAWTQMKIHRRAVFITSDKKSSAKLFFAINLWKALWGWLQHFSLKKLIYLSALCTRQQRLHWCNQWKHCLGTRSGRDGSYQLYVNIFEATS